MRKNKTTIKYFYISLICLGTMFLTGSLWAAPSITNVSGTVSHGQSINISGSGFGTKTPAAPILWETFDDGMNGANISTGGKWSPYAGDGARYNNSQPYSGEFSAYNYVQYGDSHPAGFSTSYYMLPFATDTIYYSFMFRHVGTRYTTGVDKNWRINTGNNHYRGDGMIALSDGYIFYTSGNTDIFPSDDYGTGRYFSEPEYGSSTWTRHQTFVKYSTPAGTSNGYIWAAVGNQQKTFANIINRPIGYSYQVTNVLLGLMHDQGSLKPGEYHHMYIDDVYIDNTLSRVELGNASTWTACTIREVQIPSAWTNTTISVTVNRGSFRESDGSWLYVIDSSGNVNANGFPIRFGSTSGDIIPPSPPSGVVIQK